MVNEGFEKLLGEFLKWCIQNSPGYVSQEKFAADILVNKEQVNRWTTGYSTLQPKSLNKIADHVYRRCTIEEFQVRKEDFLSAATFFRLHDQGDGSLGKKLPTLAEEFLVDTKRRLGNSVAMEEQAEVYSPTVSKTQHIRSRNTMNIESFVGRDVELRQLHTALQDSDAVAVVGPAGIGKTSVCRAYCDTQSGYYDHFALLDVKDELKLLSSFQELASHMKIEVGEKEKLEVTARRVLEENENSSERWFLIFDDFQDTAFSRRWVPRNTKVALTTRTKLRGIVAIEIDGLAKKHSVSILTMTSGRSECNNELAALANLLDYNPLGLTIAGAWLAYVPSMSVVGYYDRISDIVEMEPKRVGVVDYQLSIYATIGISLSELSNDAMMLIRISAFLDGSGISSTFFALIRLKYEEFLAGHPFFGPVPAELWAMSFDEARIETAISELAKLNLSQITKTDGQGLLFSIHNLTQVSVKLDCDRLCGRTGQSWELVATAFIAAVVPQNPSSPSYHQLSFSLLPHIKRIAFLETNSAAQDYVLNQAGSILNMIGENELACDSFERSYELVVLRTGRQSQESLSVQSNLSLQYMKLGNFHQAILHGYNSFQIAMEAPYRLEIGSGVFSNFGLVLKQASGVSATDSKYTLLKQALKVHQQALSHNRHTSGDAAIANAPALCNIAGVRLVLGQHEAALRLFYIAVTKSLNKASDDWEHAKVLRPFSKALISQGLSLSGYKEMKPLDMLYLCEFFLCRIGSEAVASDLFDVKSWIAVVHLIYDHFGYQDERLTKGNREIVTEICELLGVSYRDYVSDAEPYIQAVEKRLLIKR